MTEHHPIVKGRRGKGLRSRAAKRLKADRSTASAGGRKTIVHTTEKETTR